MLFCYLHKAPITYIRLLRSSDFVTMLDEQSENITDVYP